MMFLSRISKTNCQVYFKFVDFMQNEYPINGFNKIWKNYIENGVKLKLMLIGDCHPFLDG